MNGQQGPFFQNPEVVPFRLTPNLQNFMTPVGMEGIFTSAIMAIARALIEAEFDFSQYIPVFVREELLLWHNMPSQRLSDEALKEKVLQNVEHLSRRAQVLACSDEREGMNSKLMNAPVTQTLLGLIAQATNPQKLAQTELAWMQWL